MCHCNPSIRTPFCGKPGCTWPDLSAAKPTKESLDTLRERLKEAKSLVEEIQAQINDKLSRTLVRCEGGGRQKGCGLGFEVRELDYIQTFWYESPHGCMGGDTWHMGEGKWVCPKCFAENRLYDKPEINALKSLFKSVKESHEK